MDEQKDFTSKLTRLFSMIDDLQRDSPMNDGEYLEFAKLVKELNAFRVGLIQHTVFIDMVERATRPPRQRQAVANKDCDPNYWFCDRCDNHILKKHKARHLKSDRCQQIYNSKCISAKATHTAKQVNGVFAKDPKHIFHRLGAVIQRDFLLHDKPANLAEMKEEMDLYRSDQPLIHYPEITENYKSIREAVQLMCQ